MSNIDNYVGPKVTRTVQQTVYVSLADFKPEEMAEYMRLIGYRVDGTFSRAMLDAINNPRRRYRSCAHCEDADEIEGLLIEDDQLGRIQTLLLCGQRDSAREYLFDLVSDYIGRNL